MTPTVRRMLGYDQGHFAGRRGGLTLAELLIVIAILAVTGTLVLPAVSNSLSDARGDVTRQSLTLLRDVIAETYWQDSGGLLPQRDTTVTPVPANRMNTPQVRYLFINPHTEDTTVTYDPTYRRGWRGPYLVLRNGSLYSINVPSAFTEQYGETGDPAVLDGWVGPS